jgi:tetratricopeptide (TPR) repeat protein
VSDIPYRPHRAKRLASIAERLLEQCNLAACVRFASRAMNYDPLGVLDHEYAALRAVALRELGNERAWAALNLYNTGCKLEEGGQFDEAEKCYLESFRLDPKLIWPLNNLAWLLASSPKPALRDGRRARDYAEAACRLSNWNCWAFISTLAAAHKECGDFARAIRLQQRAIETAPPGNDEDITGQLACYRAKRAYVDTGAKLAAGSTPKRDDSQLLQ